MALYFILLKSIKFLEIDLLDYIFNCFLNENSSTVHLLIFPKFVFLFNLYI
jgi:hypothetical protein